MGGGHYVLNFDILIKIVGFLGIFSDITSYFKRKSKVFTNLCNIQIACSYHIDTDILNNNTSQFVIFNTLICLMVFCILCF
jgi:hypothetical protein